MADVVSARNQKRQSRSEGPRSPQRESEPAEPLPPAAERSHRLAFARSFPADPQLDALLARFERGEYGRVRREARALAAEAEDEGVRDAARELERRVQPDRLALGLLLIGVALLVLLSSHYLLADHAAAPRPRAAEQRA